MKKLILILFLCLCLPASALAEAGACTQALTSASSEENPRNEFRVLTFSCVFGTGADATTALALATTAENTRMVQGWYLTFATTLNGSTAPTNQYDLTLKETIGATAAAIDILGGAGADRTGGANVATQYSPLAATAVVRRPVLNTLTFGADGNAVVSGAFSAQFIFAKN